LKKKELGEIEKRGTCQEIDECVRGDTEKVKSGKENRKK